MSKREHEFTDADKIKMLLWCARHCCLCGEFAGVGMEVAHLDENSSHIDDAIPVCFDCHASIGHYNPKHPRGKKYNVTELKARRDQVYEQHTNHLVAPVPCLLSGDVSLLPGVNFSIVNLGTTYPLRVRVKVTLSRGGKSYGSPNSGHYNGEYFWNLNPQQQFNGHFDIPISMMKKSGRTTARVDLIVIDIYKREHRLLLFGFVLDVDESSNWYFEPAEEVFGAVCP